MLMKIDPTSMRGSLVMTMASISPSRREVSLAEQLRRSPRFFLPRLRLEKAALYPESFLMFFSRLKPFIQQKMDARGWPGGPKAREARPQACGHLLGPLLLFLQPVFFIYSKTILRKFSAHLEMCRIGNSDVAFSSSEFQLPSLSLFV